MFKNKKLFFISLICRFINADNYELVAELSSVAGQLNMYAYCGNNPIMCTDESGEIGWIIGLIAGFNLGSFLISVLNGLNPPEPVEMPTSPQPPVQVPSITSVL